MARRTHAKRLNMPVRHAPYPNRAITRSRAAVPILTYSGQEAGLLPVSSSVWQDSDVPLEQRGIDGRFWYQFFHEVQDYRQHLTQAHELSFWRDNVLDPPEWTARMQYDLNSRLLVADHIIPWTKSMSAPLYARIPEGSRGQPNTFISYSWDAPFLASGYGILYAVKEHLKDGDFVWMDAFCHNQHRVGSVAPQMEKVIDRVQRLLLPMSQPPWFERCWCIWEVLCAFRANKQIVFIEYDRKERDMYRIRNYFLSQFRSMWLAETSVAEDKALILQQAQDVFGSIDAADKYLLSKMNEVIGDTRQPGEHQ
jgi:hypothetical protein